MALVIDMRARDRQADIHELISAVDFSAAFDAVASCRIETLKLQPFKRSVRFGKHVHMNGERSV